MLGVSNPRPHDGPSRNQKYLPQSIGFRSETTTLSTNFAFRQIHAIMSDNDEVEVDAPAFQVLPKDISAEIGTIKLFNKWSYEDVEIRDISLT